MAGPREQGSQEIPLKVGERTSSATTSSPADRCSTAQSPKSILKCTASPDIKSGHCRTLAWQDFHGKELYSVLEFVNSDEEQSDDEEAWVGSRPCCSIM